LNDPVISSALQNRKWDSVRYLKVPRSINAGPACRPTPQRQSGPSSHNGPSRRRGAALGSGSLKWRGRMLSAERACRHTDQDVCLGYQRPVDLAAFVESSAPRHRYRGSISKRMTSRQILPKLQS